MEKGTELIWEKSCIYIGSKYSTIVNMNKKPIHDEESLKYYCFRCEHMSACKNLLQYAQNGGSIE